MTTNYFSVRVQANPLSSTVDPPSFSLAYIATDASTDPADLATKVITGLTTTVTGMNHALSAYLSPAIDRTALSGHILVYAITGHLDGSPHGSPVYTVGWTPTAAVDTSGWPEGICADIGLVAAYGSDVEFGPSSAIPTPADIVADYGAASTHTGHTRPRARDRGRVSFGPLSSTAFNWDGTNHRSVIYTTFLTDVQYAFGKMLVQPVLTSGTAQLGVWSRRNVSIKPAITVRVDSRPGYQRRRVDPAGYGLTQTIPF